MYRQFVTLIYVYVMSLQSGLAVLMIFLSGALAVYITCLKRVTCKEDGYMVCLALFASCVKHKQNVYLIH